MIDFKVSTYKKLIENLIENKYELVSFYNFISKSPDKTVILRHDVDKLPSNSLRIAKILKELNVTGSFYFRIVNQSFDVPIMEEIASLGHEIGYHYEDLTFAKGNIDRAIELFESHLSTFRKVAPINTICMHGSPLSKWDNREIWKHIDYKKYDIIGEPYFDIDFNEVYYLTDTGRTWNKSSVSVRDKVDSPFKLSFKSTHDIIQQASSLPNKIMINFHPQRWNDNPLLWTQELIGQNIKNIVKRYVFVKK
ncbi:MAG: hypothetical protein MI922_02290 [Bacteroidales bacterium]|nr:hypothetical protein [Bacteroidales bacterium]